MLNFLPSSGVTQASFNREHPDLFRISPEIGGHGSSSAPPQHVCVAKDTQCKFVGVVCDMVGVGAEECHPA